MNQIHPTVAASLKGSIPNGFLSAPVLQAIDSKTAAPEKRASRSHWTKIGEGGANVEVCYDFDDEGDIETMQVFVDGEGKNIKDALTQGVIIEIEAECHESSESDYEEGRYDTAIDDAADRRMAA